MAFENRQHLLVRTNFNMETLVRYLSQAKPNSPVTVTYMQDYLGNWVYSVAADRSAWKDDRVREHVGLGN